MKKKFRVAYEKDHNDKKMKVWTSVHRLKIQEIVINVDIIQKACMILKLTLSRIMMNLYKVTLGKQTYEQKWVDETRQGKTHIRGWFFSALCKFED